MTRLLDQAFQKLQALPPERQDEAARMLLAYADDNQPAYHFTAEEMADLDEAEAEVARGDIATDQELRAVLAKHGL